MTFVTKVPCAHVIHYEIHHFLYGTSFLSHARKGQWRQNLCGGCDISLLKKSGIFDGYLHRRHQKLVNIDASDSVSAVRNL